ncbi:hypothetical protein ACEN19_08685 [Corynebacterium auriscanis]|uniref:hypothetical protein n=1 Tax=Corynebacterium auriscanis TaxID=99807 RepID=UPI003CF14155
MKKTLLALATASTVALAGTSVAVAKDAADNPTVGPQSLGSSNTTESNPAAPNAESSNSSSSDELFGWHSEEWVDADGKTQPATSVLKKVTDIASLFGVIVTIVGGIATLIANFQKISDSFKK